MTFLHCEIDPVSGKLAYANAGHIYPLLLRAATGELSWLESDSTYPLGVRDNQKYECLSIDLEPDDTLYFISDGVVESTNDEGESFGYERFMKSAKKYRGSGPRDNLKGILEDLQLFVRQVPHDDDLTIIIARYKPAVSNEDEQA
jgi:serine phosphatase RsbU (regulator of sigma subunit)